MIRPALVLGLSSASVLAGCYLSHGRDRDGGAVVDAPAPPCATISFEAEAVVRDPEGAAVTPRLVALEDGEVGVVYVVSGDAPVRTMYQRFDRALRPIADPVTVGSAGFTWAEVARQGETLYVAYGLAGAESVIERIDLDGASVGLPRRRVDLTNPSAFIAAGDRLTWIELDPAGPLRIRASELSLDGAPVWPDGEPVWTEHGSSPADVDVVALPGGGRVWAVPGVSGETSLRRRGPAPLTDVGAVAGRHDRWALVELEGDVVLVGGQRTRLTLSRHDATTLLPMRTTIAEATGDPFDATTIAGRVLVAEAAVDGVEARAFDEALASSASARTGLPAPRATGDLQAIPIDPGAAVIATTLSDEAGMFVWIARLECGGT